GNAVIGEQQFLTHACLLAAARAGSAWIPAGRRTKSSRASGFFTRLKMGSRHACPTEFTNKRTAGGKTCKSFAQTCRLRAPIVKPRTFTLDDDTEIKSRLSNYKY
ncbi:hypothetical protein, partial [Geoalkalibacter sp.]|uniref:hypothetical protein n=1 Tax=Geoalkalibacter sp. TaxID=3041440 RepID=UPI00272ECBEE